MSSIGGDTRSCELLGGVGVCLGRLGALGGPFAALAGYPQIYSMASIGADRWSFFTTSNHLYEGVCFPNGPETARTSYTINRTATIFFKVIFGSLGMIATSTGILLTLQSLSLLELGQAAAILNKVRYSCWVIAGLTVIGACGHYLYHTLHHQAENGADVFQTTMRKRFLAFTIFVESLYLISASLFLADKGLLAAAILAATAGGLNFFYCLYGTFFRIRQPTQGSGPAPISADSPQSSDHPPPASLVPLPTAAPVPQPAPSD